MRFEPRHVFLGSPYIRGRAVGNSGTNLPSEIAFLGDLGVDRAILWAAAATARKDRVCAARALVADEGVGATFYYKALAGHLGLPFVTDWPCIEPSADPLAVCRDGFVRLTDASATSWLVAPESETLRAMLDAARGAPILADVAITTPAHLAALVHYHAQAQVEYAATEAFPKATPAFSAKGAVDTRVRLWGAAVAIVAMFGCVAAPRVLGVLLGISFFIGASFRLVFAAEGLATQDVADERIIPDAALPSYTILAPLRQEAALVPHLLDALAAIDYPRAKLEVLMIVEPEDLETRAALAAQDLPPWLHVILGPYRRHLRTKPRALNLGLLMARGDLLTVYDAEDRPDPYQLRRAANLFAEAPADLACVQARLAIDNGDRSWLARMFALEYAALFDVLNIGMASLDLPMALGGTSNHFRVAALRAAGGWDAWNVTEDADLGLRLARLGYRVECLASTTMESAPEEIQVWLKQRRRWMKGWMQTFLVLARGTSRLWCELGTKKVTALGVLFVNLVVGPLLFPLFCGLLIFDIVAYGMPRPHGLIEVGEATLEVSVLIFGIGATFWCAHAGMKVRGLLHFLPSLPLLLPYQLMVSVAAWMGLFDLFRSPYHWHKTVHRVAKSSGSGAGEPTRVKISREMSGLNRSSRAKQPPRRMARRRSRQD